ncbi:creatininase family protein [Nocardioides turkmenicus]|uniref:creatininase family protein n=1 Tax=Nocardioides turkmenicus TaxID=2711220 RepID=UPI0019D22294|nr:creatininase family protein [Nocardioides sp. KC13]
MTNIDVISTETTTDVIARGSKIAVLPIGSFEQHGDILPLSTDTIVAAQIASAVARANDLWLLPPITVSCSHEHSSWAGTISIPAATLIRLVEDIVASARAQGAEHVVFINGHGGNYVLQNIVQEANDLSLFPGKTDWTAAREAAGLETSAHDDMHAGEFEVSLLLHCAPDLVGPDFKHRDHHAPDRPHMLTHGLRPYTETGIIGSPSLASAEKGSALLESLSELFVSHLRGVSIRR